MKFLGFEQTFKNSLTVLQIGGAKEEVILIPTENGLGDYEILSVVYDKTTRTPGHKTDVPGAILVGYKEIGLFGQYKALYSKYEPGLITVKAPAWGGIQGRKEDRIWNYLFCRRNAKKPSHKFKRKILT